MKAKVEVKWVHFKHILKQHRAQPKVKQHFSFNISLPLSRSSPHKSTCSTYTRQKCWLSILVLPSDIRNAFASPCRPLPVTLSQYSSRIEVWFDFLCMCLTSMCHTSVWQVFDVTLSTHFFFFYLRCLCQMLQVKNPQSRKLTASWLHLMHFTSRLK